MIDSDNSFILVLDAINLPLTVYSTYPCASWEHPVVNLSICCSRSCVTASPPGEEHTSVELHDRIPLVGATVLSLIT